MDIKSKRGKVVATRKQRLKKRKRKKRIILCIFAIFTAIISYFSWKLYVINKSKDLQYAIESSLTSGNEDERLLRVKNITLIFNDNNTAVIEASGLSKSEPHSSLKIKGYYKKGFMDSWQLEKAYKLNC